MPAGRIPATGHVVDMQTQARAPVNQTLYVNKVGSDGWLQAKPANGPFVPLHKYTKVVVTQVVAGRTYFKVLEGHHKGQVLSLQDANAKEYLGTAAPIGKPVSVTITYGAFVPRWVSQARRGEEIDQQMATLEVAGIRVQLTMNSVWDPALGYYPLPPGTYTILLPDMPHRGDMTNFYRSVAPNLKYDQVWFPIKYGNNSRYVHVGNVSDGCATVLDIDRWSDIHEALISHRAADGVSVGQMVVKGTPERSR